MLSRQILRHLPYTTRIAPATTNKNNIDSGINARPLLLPPQSLSSSSSRASSLLSPTRPLLIMASEATRRRQNVEFQHNRPNDFDIDKEKWGKQMQFASLECVIDPSVTPINLWSFTGLRKMFSQWVSMKKLQERRPSFSQGDLLELFLTYKTLQNSLDPDKFRTLARYTTHAEAERLSKEGTTELHARMKNSSWRSIATNQHSSASSSADKNEKSKSTSRSGGGAAGGGRGMFATARRKNISSSSSDSNNNNDKNSTKNSATSEHQQSAEDKASKAESINSSASNSKKKQDATKSVLARRCIPLNIMATMNAADAQNNNTKSDKNNNNYELEIDKFEITNCFMGTMTAEDWIQITVKAEYRERNASVGPLSHKVGGFGTGTSAAEALRKRALYQHQMSSTSSSPSSSSSAVSENSETDRENENSWTKIVEFPVFEVKLGDGVASANTQPFSVVAVMDKDGSRHGKDGNDASVLRKNFAGTSKNTFGFNR